MPFRLQTENIPAWEKVVNFRTGTVIEGDIIVPDVKPDLKSVMVFDGECRIVSVETMYGRLVVNCRNRYKVIYISDEGAAFPRSIENSANHTLTFDIPEARSGMDAQVDCVIEHLEYNILNGRKLGYKLIISVTAVIRNEEQKELTLKIQDDDSLEVLTKKINFLNYYDKLQIGEVLRESFELPYGKPNIREILRTDLRISNKSITEQAGVISVSADVSVKTLYAADDESYSLNFMENVFEFTKDYDLDEGEIFERLELILKPGLETCDALEDGDGEKRVIDIQAILDGRINFYTNRELDIIRDAYSTESNVVAMTQTDVINHISFAHEGQLLLKEQLEKKDIDHEIVDIFNVTAEIDKENLKINESNNLLSGVVVIKIICSTNDEDTPLFSQQFIIPFSGNIEKVNEPTGGEYFSDAEVESVSCSISGNGNLELRIVVSYNVSIEEKIFIENVKAFNDKEEERNVSKATMMVYFSKFDEALWDIAKRYSTTIEKIKELNQLSELDISCDGSPLVVKFGK